MTRTVIEHLRMLLDPPHSGLSIPERNTLVNALYFVLRKDKAGFWDTSDKDPERLTIMTTVHNLGMGTYCMSLHLYTNNGKWEIVCSGNPKAGEEEAMKGLQEAASM